MSSVIIYTGLQIVDDNLSVELVSALSWQHSLLDNCNMFLLKSFVMSCLHLLVLPGM